MTANINAQTTDIPRASRSVSRIVIVTLSILASAHIPGAFAQSRASAAESIQPSVFDDRTSNFVRGNLEFLLIHELAHVLINEKQIPIIGPTEGAADYLATIALIRTEPFDSGHTDQTLDFLLAAADAFSAAWDIGSSIGAEIPYWSGHALGIQRYYQIACLLYGSDPTRFRNVVELAQLPEARANSCAAEFEQANQSVQWLIDTFGRQPDDPVAANQSVLYEEPRTVVAAQLVQLVRSAGLIDQTLARFSRLFYLERPLTIAFRNCGMSEAAWIPEQRELVVCHELLNMIYLLSLKVERNSLGRALQ